MKTMPDFPMVAVTSSQIYSVGYRDGKLRVRFHDRTLKDRTVPGGTYVYDDVPPDAYALLLAADADPNLSVGKHFGRHIRGGKYAYRKVED